MAFLKRHPGILRALSVLLVIALVLLFKVDLGETLAILANANVILVLLAVAGFVPFLAVKAWRWQIILRDLGVPIPFSQALRLYALGLGAGMITPGNVGDAIKVAYFRERGFSQSVISVVLDRVWDVLILLLLAGSGIFLFAEISAGEWLALAGLTLGTLAALVLTIHPRSQHWIFKQFLRLRKKPSSEGSYEPATFSPRQILVQFGLSVLATLVVYGRLALVTLALGISLAPLPFVAAMSLASIASLLAIAPGGLGTREGVLLLLASPIGITPSQALALSALIFLLQLVNGVVGFAVWVGWRLEIRDWRLRANL